MTDLQNRLGQFITELREPDDTVGISPSSEYAEGWVDAQEDAADRLSALLDEYSSVDETYVVITVFRDTKTVQVDYAGSDADRAKQQYDDLVDDLDEAADVAVEITVWNDGDLKYKTTQHPDDVPPSLVEKYE